MRWENGEFYFMIFFFSFFYFSDFWQFSVDDSPKRTRPKNAALSWRRLSMRKTCPIDLPEQQSPRGGIRVARTSSSSVASTATATATATNQSSNMLANDFANNTNYTSLQLNRTNYDGNNDNYCFNETMPPIASTNTRLFQSNIVAGASENNQMSTPTNGVQQRNDHVLSNNNEYIDSRNQLPELSSLNNEFLSTILTTPNYQQSNTNSASLLQHETNFEHSIDDEIGQITNPTALATTTTAAAATFEESRPRQLGRRSEMRSRIVSITAERNAEGNQVNNTLLD